MLIGPPFAGSVYDTSQSYFITLLGFAAASFLAMLLVLGEKRRTADPARAQEHRASLTTPFGCIYPDGS